MAQNTLSITSGNLTVKYSPKYPIGGSEITKLETSLDLARHALKKAIDVLHRIETAKVVSPTVLPEVTFLVLRLHFRFKPESFTSARSEWVRPVNQITNNLRQIQSGLMRSVTIADAQASIVGRAVDKELAEFRSTLGGRSPSEDEKDKLLDRLAEANRQGGDKAAKTMGIVYLKKSFAGTLLQQGKLDAFAENQMVWDFKKKQLVPGVEVRTEQRGSIHVNFQQLLKEEKQVSALRVARTIIHEASHKFCNTQDHAYATNAGYRMLQDHEALWNADSYAYCAVSLYKGVCFLTDDQMAREHIDMNS